MMEATLNRITSSVIKDALRCPHTAALRLMGEEGAIPPSRRKAMLNGNLFELVITGNRSTRYKDRLGFGKWMMDRATAPTRARVEAHGAWVRDNMLPSLHEPKTKIGFEVSFRLGDTELNGEVDAMTDVNLLDGTTEEGVLVDFKYTDNIGQIWDPDFRGDPLNMLQGIFYPLVYAFQSSPNPEIISRIGEAALAGKPVDQGDFQLWASTAVVPKLVFIICEDTAVEHEKVPRNGGFEIELKAQPRIATYIVEPTPYDALWLFDTVRGFIRAMTVLVRNNNAYNQGIESRLEPGPGKCEGRYNRKGVCPFIDQCVFYKTYLNRPRRYALQDLLAMDS